ncbi:integrase [Desulfuromonas soudanensis]|uniref:Integrase n=1 Tax=Desulfuromonas soudanensis TaxID=1603606 RepID=A0A0M4D425_9BACT|nr:site-specific integrase [Desulfuromonas soudanensis]ALC18058.1 integrase [Desulfuromonas soudanensis]
MKKKKFDDLTVRKSLKPSDSVYMCMAENEPGFGIRVYPSGRKAFFYQYKLDGYRRFMTLGDYPATSLKTARDFYQTESSKVKALRRGSKDGLDPVLENKNERQRRMTEHADHRNALSVADLVKEFMEKHSMVKKKSWKEDKRVLEKDVIPLWGTTKAKDITKKDVNELCDTIINRGALIMANNAFAKISKMFNFAVERGIIEHSPCYGLSLPSKKVHKDRVLAENEIRNLWENLDTSGMSNEVKRALKLMLVTAQRPGEVLGMHVNEIDGHWWTIPKERAKNGKAHRVYLTAMALLLIGDTNGKGHIFISEHSVKPIESNAAACAVRRNLEWPIRDNKGNLLYGEDGKLLTENRLSINKFTPHDLRRTAATGLSRLRFSNDIIDAVLNHAAKGVISIYNRNNYDDEKQESLNAWSNKLTNIICGEGVGNENR